MISDRIEWDERNLDHATQRLTAAEIEQAIWNAARDERSVTISVRFSDEEIAELRAPSQPGAPASSP
ncbi:MAG: hypothetical protein H0U51_01510 [Propionibacteriales bacterium]|nr:hypothetical protein [Propionibacteriales bacterium]